ncbi:hypothetical protein [Silvibacterium dinghuense]|uniref:Uncharacterized protein n=1 Tax=Silvibacterium dinghuense TaxID=1560006 RepID=A0A4Q1SJX2_9BACT|nr:hypothetical protein [Silvibacterium dinghuense]RXS97966.1 hypothetical protein ESZ00_08975 [Silvibacterium dinghuense]GGH03421.1 hypothetical protein GCM10011586_19200 [Silvibacterium dinghuense]
MSLSVTSLYSAAQAVEPSFPISSLSDSSSGSASNNAAAENSGGGEPKPTLTQQIRDLYQQGQTVTEIAADLYTTVSIVDSDLDFTPSTLELDSTSVQLTA